MTVKPLLFLAAFTLVTLVTVHPAMTGEPTAAEMRLQAHHKRAVWHDFPGFTAQVTISTDEKSQSGQIRVGADFKHTLNIPGAAEDRWIAAKLRSVISHRKPGEAREYDVRFVDDDASHVSGRLIAHNDGSGMFRIRDGVIWEVIRKSEKSWFEVSTLETVETPDGKILPRSTSTTYRDPKTGDITSNHSNFFGCKQVGGFFLPESALTIEVGANGTRTVRRITFDDHQLATP